MSFVPNTTGKPTTVATPVAQTTTTSSQDETVMNTLIDAITVSMTEAYPIEVIVSMHSEHEEFKVYNSGIIGQFTQQAGLSVADAYKQAKEGNYLKTSNLDKIRTDFFNTIRQQLGMSMEGAVSTTDRDLIHRVINTGIYNSRVVKLRTTFNSIITGAN